MTTARDTIGTRADTTPRGERLRERYDAGEHLTSRQVEELRAYLGGRLPGELDKAAAPARPIYQIAPLREFRTRRAPQRDPVARKFALGLLARSHRSRPSVTIGQWAEQQKLTIPPEESHGTPGAYRESTEPVASIVHQFLTDPRYSTFIGLKPSRIGFTVAAIVGMAYWLANVAQNIIFCIDDQRQVKKFAKKRLIPILKSIPALADIMPTDKRELSALVLYFKGLTLHLGGARSIADVTSITAGLVVGDEVDQWKDFASGEASAFWHLLDRVMDVPGGKAVFFGKPRNETDILYTQYMTGTRHKCFVPCPHCGFMQTLDWENLVFEHCKEASTGNYDLARVKREVFYRCASPECRAQPHEGKIFEHQKPAMLGRHEWKQTYFGDDPDFQFDPEKMTAQCNQLYSLRPRLTWGNIAAHFITARREGGVALAHFFRTRFAEPERRAQAITKKEEVTRLANFTTPAALREWWKSGDHARLDTVPRRPYLHGECPFVPARVFMFCDVQTETGEKKWTKVAFTETGEAAVIDYGILLSFADLIPEADKEIVVVDWGGVPLEKRWSIMTSVVWIDEGGSNNKAKHEIEVREFCAREDTIGRFFPSKGAGGLQIKTLVQENKRIVPTEEFGDVEIFAYHFSHDAFASELVFGRIKKHEEALLALAQGLDLAERSLPPPLWIPAHCDDTFIAEMCSEVLQRKKVHGRYAYVWTKRNNRANDFEDGVKGCLAMNHFARGGAVEDEDEADDAEN